MAADLRDDYEPRPELPVVPNQLLNRLEEHLRMIAAQDWDYFAVLRYRSDAQTALSDLARLETYLRGLEAVLHDLAADHYDMTPVEYAAYARRAAREALGG